MVSDNGGFGYTTSTLPHSYQIDDNLSRFRTRDLLNECYRRRAIDRFAINHKTELFRQDLETGYAEQVSRYQIQTLLDSLAQTSYFKDRVLHSTNSYDYRTHELYVCTHPKKLK